MIRQISSTGSSPHNQSCQEAIRTNKSAVENQHRKGDEPHSLKHARSTRAALPRSHIF
jgi:hypothetical protein